MAFLIERLLQVILRLTLLLIFYQIITLKQEALKLRFFAVTTTQHEHTKQYNNLFHTLTTTTFLNCFNDLLLTQETNPNSGEATK